MDVFNVIGILNSSKYFTGVVMIMLNIGSRFVEIKLSDSMEQYIKYNIAALKQNVKGECETFEAILDCLIISTSPVTDTNAVSFNVICQTFPRPGRACFKI